VPPSTASLQRLAESPPDLTRPHGPLLEALAGAVPFDAFCWGAVDPASLLPTRGVGTFAAGRGLRFQAHELLVRELRHGGVRVLSESPAHRRAVRRHGYEHLLCAALTVDGACWGFLHLERRAGRAGFSPGDVALVAAIVPPLAAAFRRALVADPPAALRAPRPGVIVFDDEDEVESISPEAEAWLAEWGAGGPPLGVAAVVAAARAGAAASARVRLPSRAWLLVRGTRLRGARGPRTAVVLEPAPAGQVAPLVARAHGLTARETEVAVLVLRGLGTEAIAARLAVSPYTVQDHLKAVFDKVGVRGRRALVAEVFAPHLAA
jgi:DNA-binding CsgD family transcriptional regulator